MPTDVKLDFSTAISGTVLDKDLEGTGFTSVQNNTSDNAYDLGLIDLNTSASTLALVATQGDNTTANTLKNGLQVAIDAATQPFTIAARLKGSFTTTLTTAEQQGGIFLGSGEDDYVKLVIVNSSNDSSGLGLQFFQEQSGLGSTVGGGSGAQIKGLDWANINTLDLFLTGDPTTGTIKAAYRVNSDTATPTAFSQQLTASSAVKLLTDEAIARAGILAYTGSAPETTVTFDSFNIKAAGSTPFSWNTAEPTPIARFEAQGIAVNDNLYVFGGFFNSSVQATTRSDVYAPAKNTWTRIADMPEALTHASVAVDGQTIYLVGGYLGDDPGLSTNHVWQYNTVTNEWSAAPSLPAPRGAGAAVVLNRNLHFFGGATRTAGQFNDTDQGSHYVLPLDGGTGWSNLASLPNPRNHLAGVALGGQIYAIGGQHARNENTGNQSQVDVYNPLTNAWKRVRDLPVPRGHTNSSAFVVDNRIAVIGGSVNGDKPSADVTMYDPQTNIWLKLPSLPAARKSPVANIIGDQIVVSTGNPSGVTPTSTTWTGVLANKWESVKPMPVALGEVAGGIIGNKLYLVGQGSSATLAHNLSTGTWSSTSSLAKRPYVGHHHGAEVINGKLYLIGGLGSGAGKVQIYNPATNTWNLGRDMPFAAGSSSTVVIKGEIYVAGGIVGSTTTAKVAKYNPATNTWKLLASMKQGRNHAAAVTDGSKLYIFGGRGLGSGDTNTVANGFNTVQIYNPATNTWVSSLNAGSIAPLPQARGGMGKAVYFGGEFYVMGGETQTGTGATLNNVYSRVDIYNPRTNSWRLGTPMPTARHGIFPLLLAGRIHIAGGGIRAGNSSSSLLEIYNPF